jgi:rhodanese-related sulfurtransferase
MSSIASDAVTSDTLSRTSVPAADVPAIDAATLQRWLHDGAEIALLDVREHGQYGEGHPFLAVSAPYSRLETEVPRLVPRLATRVVLLDDATSPKVAVRAARRLRGLGYNRVWTLAGGAEAWAANGHALFQGQNLPSKTFGEQVEHVFEVPHLSAQALQARQAAGEALVLLDGRTLQEHRKMTIPGALPLPNGELALRWRSVVPDDKTSIVVHCAGRTRSIIGAQILRDLGVPNPVYALENGTQGWALAGLELERGSPRSLPGAPDPTQREAAQQQARAAAARAGAPELSAAQAQAWLDDPEHTTFVFDVRTAEEFAAGSLLGARHAPGGQLLQTTDQHVGVRGARILLLDDDGIRAGVVAAWLRRLGHEAATVSGGIAAPLRLPTTVTPALPEAPAEIGLDELRAWRASGRALPVLVDLRASTDYRRSHTAGSTWSIRPRLVDQVRQACSSKEPGPVWLLADDAATAALAAQDLREAGWRQLAWASASALAEAGWPQESTPQQPTDADSIDYLFFVHDRHEGNLEAARRYLQWETGLVAQCALDELGVFRLKN